MNHAFCTARDAVRASETGRGRGETTQRTLFQRQAQFQILVARTRQGLYRFALRNLGNSQDAEDVTQEALMRAWTHFETYDPHRSFEAWVCRIANNLMIDRNRRRRRRPEISLDASAVCMEANEGVCQPELSRAIEDPQNSLLVKEIRAELRSALRSLPPLHQATLLLVAQDFSYEEIARTLDCPVGTVRSRVHRARFMLQCKLKARTF